MTTAAPITHVLVDKAGVAWIDEVIEVIQDHLAHGVGAEEIHLQHPHLSLAQIHSAFAYYFDHRNEIDTEIARRYREVEARRAKSTHQPSRKKLLARLNKR